MGNLQTAYKYLRHIFTAKWSYGFRVHSPYIYNFTKFVIYEKNPYYIFPKIEERRKELLKDNRTIQVDDFGTGQSGIRLISNIAKNSLKSPKYAQLIHRIAKDAQAENILELGTSLGITTAYLATANNDSRVISMEGSSEIASIAKETFQKLDINNIEVIVGDINGELPRIINGNQKFDLIFIDANHTSKAVLEYFETCLSSIHSNSIIVIDDVYWSEDMECAWKTIKQNKQVTATIDVFQMGIVFFNPDLYKKDYKMLL